MADSKTSGRVNKSSSIIWPAMGHRCHHPNKRRLIQSRWWIYQPAAYGAHFVERSFRSRTPLHPTSSVAGDRIDLYI